MVEELNKLYNAVSSQYDIGDYDSFSAKMKTPEQRKSFYDSVNKAGYDLGDYDNYEKRLSTSSSQETAEPEPKKGFWDSYIGDTIESVGAGAAGASGGIYSGIGKLMRNDVLHGNMLSDVADWFDGQAKNSYDYAQILKERANRYNGESFIDLWNKDDKAGSVGEVFLKASESLPQSLTAIMATMAGMPGVGLGITGFTSGMQDYDLNEDTQNLPEIQKINHAIAIGSFEALSERLGDVPIGNMFKKLYVTQGAEVAEEAVKKGFKGWMMNQYKRLGALSPIIAEGSEEFANQIAGNATDMVMGIKKDGSILDGTFEAFVYGAGGGAQFSAITVPGKTKQWNDKRKYDAFMSEKREEFSMYQNTDGMVHAGKDQAGENIFILSETDDAITAIYPTGEKRVVSKSDVERGEIMSLDNLIKEVTIRGNYVHEAKQDGVITQESSQPSIIDNENVINSTLEHDGTVVVEDEEGNLRRVPIDTLNNENEESPSPVVEEKQFPRTKDNEIDYDAINEPSTYTEALIEEFGEEDAKSVLNEYIAYINEEIDKNKKKNKANKIEQLRQNKKLNERLSFYQDALNLTTSKPTNEQEDGAIAVEQDSNNGLEFESPETYNEYLLSTSEDAIEINNAYQQEIEQIAELMPWEQDLLSSRIDKQQLIDIVGNHEIEENPLISRMWLGNSIDKNGEKNTNVRRLDDLAQELSEKGIEVTPQMIADFILSNPGKTNRKTTSLSNDLSKRFSDVASKKSGLKIGGPNSTTGKLFLETEQLKQEIDKKKYEKAVIEDTKLEDYSYLLIELEDNAPTIQDLEEWENGQYITPEDYNEIMAELEAIKNERNGHTDTQGSEGQFSEPLHEPNAGIIQEEGNSESDSRASESPTETNRSTVSSDLEQGESKQPSDVTQSSSTNEDNTTTNEVENRINNNTNNDADVERRSEPIEPNASDVSVEQEIIPSEGISGVPSDGQGSIEVGESDNSNVQKRESEQSSTDSDRNASSSDGATRDTVVATGEQNTDTTGSELNRGVDVPNQEGQSIPDRDADARSKRSNPTESQAREVHLNEIREALPQLFPEQQEDVLKAEERFAKGKGILFTNGTGTGKTYTGLGVIKRAINEGKKNILIVVPTDAKAKDWIQDGTNLSVDITQLEGINDSGSGVNITTYANFYQNEDLINRDMDLIVYDECHYIGQGQKGVAEKIFNAHQKLCRLPRQAILLAEEKLSDKKPERIKDATNEEQNNYDKAFAKWQEDCLELAKELHDRTKVVMLSASPFAYHANITYADGVLFDISNTFEEKSEQTGYNAANGFDKFMINNFGYRMRYNKLTKPESGVDINLMEREFYERYKEQGIISGRQLQVDKDYSREFVQFESEEADAINEGMSLFLNYDKEFKDKFPQLTARIEKKWNYLYINQLLESLKAAQVKERVQAHLDMGRKVVIFHNYNNGTVAHPFRFNVNDMLTTEESKDESSYRTLNLIKSIEQEIAIFNETYPHLVNMELNGLKNVRETINDLLGDKCVEFNGQVSKKKRSEHITQFNQKDSGVDVILVNRQAGKEGISLHDKNGDAQRVLIDLGLPTRPTDAIQTEGRIYRLGVLSDAIIEYPVLRTQFEQYMYAQTIATRAKTAENLAMGNQARDMETAFKEGYLNSTNAIPSIDQGKGGKESDRSINESSEFNKAKSYYFGNQKKTSSNKSKEGADYFATPEPVGFKMVEWACARSNESMLEPSAGHGAIGRFFPGTTTNTFIEPSYELSTRLGLYVNGDIQRRNFEDLHIMNKYDCVVMNPPFGTAGKTTMEHIEKGFRHLREGGRLVAIMPSGPSMQKRMNEFLYGTDSKGNYPNSNAVLSSRIKLPSCTFERAATNVNCEVVIIDKISDKEQRKNVYPSNIDLTYCNTIGDLFEAIEELCVPSRINNSTVEGVSIPSIDPNPQISETNTSSMIKESDFEITEFTHTKTNETLYLLKPTRYLGNSYNSVSNKVKENGGYYSSYVKGFIFKERSQAEKTQEEAALFRSDNQSISYNKTDVKQICNELNVSANIVSTREELPGHIKAQMGNSRYPGVYDAQTGEVYLIEGEIIDAEDARATLFHEVVGHKGIRALKGKGLELFLDNVFYSMSKENQASYLEKYGNSQLAAEEYLAEFAEGYHDLNSWQKAKGYIKSFLRDMGLNLKLNDIDLMFTLWRGQNALKNNPDFIEQHKKVENALFRELPDGRIPNDKGEGLMFEKPNWLHKFKNNIVDNAIDIKELILEVKKRGGNVADYSNVYQQFLLSTSISKHQTDVFRKEYMEPLLEDVKLFSKHFDYEDIEMYMRAKHARERNAHILKQSEGKIIDGSGMSNIYAAETVIHFEKTLKENNIDEQAIESFWNKVRNATKFSLETQYKHGQITKESYESTKDMYEYYVPLRGFDEAETDGTDYSVSERASIRPVSMPMKHAKGRKTLSDGPIAYIANMAQTAIVTGNKNDVRKALWNLIVSNNDMRDLFRMNRVYLVEVGKDDMGFPIYEEQYTRPSKVLFDEGKVKTSRHVGMNIRGKTADQIKAHYVETRIDGVNYVMELLGTKGVQIGETLNGRNRVIPPKALDYIGQGTRWMSANMTAKNPAFIPYNHIRDVLFASFAFSIEKRDFKSFVKNMPKAYSVIHDYYKGNMNNPNMVEYKLFMDNGGLTGYVHMESVDDIRKYIQKDIKRALGGLTKKEKAYDTIFRNKAMMAGANMLEYMAEMSENSARFATYLTERQNGKTPKDAAYLAKEITVNFNRKGAWTPWIGCLYSFVNASIQGVNRGVELSYENRKRFAVAATSLAGMQMTLAVLCRALGGEDELGESNYDNLSDYVKFTNMVFPAGDGKFITIPYPPFLRMFAGIGTIVGDCMAGKRDIENVCKSLYTIISSDMMPVDMSFSEINEGLAPVFNSAIPTVMKPFYEAYISNTNFMGQTISKKPLLSTIEDRLPQYKMTKRGTNKSLILFSKWLNEQSGGTETTSSKIQIDDNGDINRSWWGEMADFNPGKLEHMVLGMLGGRATFFSNIVKTATSVAEGEMPKSYNLPVIRRFYNTPYSNSSWDKYIETRDHVEDIKKVTDALYKEGRYEDYRNVMMRNAKEIALYEKYNKTIKELTDAMHLTENKEDYQELEKMRDELVTDFAKQIIENNNAKSK